MGLPFKPSNLATQIARVIHPDDKGAPLDLVDLTEEQGAYADTLAGLIENDAYIESRVNSLLGVDSETLLYRHDVSEGLWQSGFDILNHGQGTGEAPEDSACYSNLGDLETYRRPDGTIRLMLVYPTLGQFIMFEQSNNFVQDLAAGTGENVVTDFRVIASSSAAVLGSGAAAFGGLNTASNANALIDGNATGGSWWYPLGQSTLFQGGVPAYNLNGVSTTTDIIELYGVGQEAANLAQLHDGALQDAAIQAAVDNLAAEIQDRIDADGTLSARVATVEAQLPDDDSGLAAMIAANAAALAQEMADTDADVVAILANTTANMTATQTNAAAASNNAAAIALEASDREAADALLQTNIEGVGASVSVLGSTLNQSLSSEATLRANADAALDSRIALVETQLPDDDTPLANAIAENAAAIAAEILDTDADFVDVLAAIAANATVAQAAQAAAVTNAQDIAQLVSEFGNVLLDGTDQSNIGGEKTWSDLQRFLHSTNSFGTSVGTNTTEFNGTSHILRFNGPNGNEIRSTANAFIFNGTGTSLSLGATNAVFSNRLRVPATVATDNADTATSKGYVDALVSTEATARAAADTALDTRLLSLEGLDFQALVSDIAANMAEIDANDGELLTLMAQISQNATAQQANANAITTNANALAQESVDRAQADQAIQDDVDARDQENVKLTGDQDIDGDKNFASGNLSVTSPNSGAGTIRMMFGNAISGLIRFATGDLQITHFTSAGIPGARLLLSELFGQFNRRMEFAEDIDAQSNINLFDSDGSNRISLRVPSDIAANYNLILPGSPPLDDQVLHAQANGTTAWVYPFGHGFQLVEVDVHVNTVSNMDDAAALVASIDTAGFAPGLWKFEVEAHFGYNTASTDYIAGLYDEAQTNKDDVQGSTNALSYFRKEPKDVSGLDPDGAGAGTDQHEPMNLYAYIQIVENDDRVIGFRHRPGTAGTAATSRNPKFTTMRVAN